MVKDYGLCKDRFVFLHHCLTELQKLRKPFRQVRIEILIVNRFIKNIFLCNVSHQNILASHYKGTNEIFFFLLHYHHPRLFLTVMKRSTQTTGSALGCHGCAFHCGWVIEGLSADWGCRHASHCRALPSL